MLDIKLRRVLELAVVGGFAFGGPALLSQSCDLAGTWYGGGETAKYVMYITHEKGEQYSTVSQGAFNAGDVGFPLATIYSGQIVKVRENKYDGYAIGMMNTTANFPFLPTDPAANPQVWAVHSKSHLVDCDTMQINYDFFGAYLWTSAKTPFADAPDFVPVPPPFTETYKRMPMKCAYCG